MKKILPVLLLIALLPMAFAGLNVERTIAGPVGPGETVNITLKMMVGDSNAGSVIITETVPDGWTLVSSNPLASDFSGGKFKWLLYSKDLTDKTITYSLKAPDSFLQPVALLGQWMTLAGSGPVEGSALLRPKAAEPVVPPILPGPQTQGTDYSPLILGGIIVIVLVIVAAVFIIRKKPGKPEPKAK